VAQRHNGSTAQRRNGAMAQRKNEHQLPSRDFFATFGFQPLRSLRLMDFCFIIFKVNFAEILH
jgi:hypothetical protein